jgi:hypothetical protein
MARRSALRSSEWLAIGYFFYVAALAPFYVRAPWRAVALGALVAPGSAVFALILLTEETRKLRRKIGLYSAAVTITIF